MRLGKVSDSVLKRSVLKQIQKNKKEMLCGAGLGVDCAIFSPFLGEKLATCMNTTVILEKEDMEIAVVKLVNNLSCVSAKPLGMMVSILLPENAREIRIRELMEEAQRICNRFDMQIAGGHTAVSDKVSSVVVTLTGYGKSDAVPRNVKKLVGYDIVASKWIAMEGTALLAKAHKEALLGRYPAYIIDEALAFRQYLSVIPEAAVAVSSGAELLHDVSEGGIFAALWEIGERLGVGLNIDLKKIPIRQETVEVCEFLGANPYELAGSGSLLMVAKDGEALAESLREAGIPAAVIGKTTDSNDRIIRNGDETRYMDKPSMDEIYKFR